MQNGEKRDRVEIDALEVRAGAGLGKDGRHDHRADDLDFEFVEDLGQVASPTVKAGRPRNPACAQGTRNNWGAEL